LLGSLSVLVLLPSQGAVCDFGTGSCEMSPEKQVCHNCGQDNHDGDRDDIRRGGLNDMLCPAGHD
jgi:hypothetical protein